MHQLQQRPRRAAQLQHRRPPAAGAPAPAPAQPAASQQLQHHWHCALSVVRHVRGTRKRNTHTQMHILGPLQEGQYISALPAGVAERLTIIRASWMLQVWPDCWTRTCRNQDCALRSAGGTAERRRETPSAASPCSSPVSAAFFRARAPCKAASRSQRQQLRVLDFMNWSYTTVRCGAEGKLFEGKVPRQAPCL